MTRSDLPDLDAVRRAIDALDQDLVALLVRRQHLVTRAGDFKRDDAEVRAPDRAAAVVRQARDRADALGGSPELIGTIYAAMVEAYIAHERRTRLPGQE